MEIMGVGNRWGDVFNFGYFLRLDYEEHNIEETQEILDTILSGIYKLYMDNVALFEDISFLAAAQENMEDHPNRMQAFWHNCDKVQKMLSTLSEIEALDEQFQHVRTYTSDKKFKEYVDLAFVDVIALVRHEIEKEVAMPSKADRETLGEADKQEESSEVSQKYNLAIYTQFAKIAEESAEKARKAAAEAKEITEKAFAEAENAKTSAKEAMAAANNAKETAEKIIEEAQKVQKAAEETQAAAEAAKNSAESMVPNMLTVLGIFVAIIIAVVAAYISILIGQHIEDSNLASLGLAAFLVLGHILTNIIFLLLYLISKLTKYTLACNCLVSKENDCTNCSSWYGCTWMNKLWRRYPYIIVLNAFFAVGYLMYGLWVFIQTYFRTDIDDFFLNNGEHVFWAVVIVMGIVVIAAMILMNKFKGSDNIKHEPEFQSSIEQNDVSENNV